MHSARILLYGIILFIDVATMGCAGTPSVGPRSHTLRGKIVGLHIAASSDAYYDNLDSKDRPYFEEVQQVLRRKDWLAIDLSDRPKINNPINTFFSGTSDSSIRTFVFGNSEFLNVAEKEGFRYFMFIFYRFSGKDQDMPCHKVTIKAEMYDMNTRQPIFKGSAVSKDIEVFDKYPATEAGYYPDSYPNTTRYYTRRPVSWDALCNEAIEKALKHLP